AVTGLFKVTTLKHLWRADRGEFVVAMAALLGVLTSGLLRGVMIGALISLVQLLRRASRPHVAFLGRIPGARRFSDMARHPDNEPISGALLFRTEASLLCFNADYVRETVMKRVAEMGAGLRLAICDLSTSPYVDLTGAQMLAELHKELAAVNVRLQIVEARASVRDRLHAEGVEDKVGRIGRFRSLADAVEDFQSTQNG